PHPSQFLHCPTILLFSIKIGSPLQDSHISFSFGAQSLGSWSLLQNLKPRHSFANSPNSTCNARIFLSSKSCPSSPFSFTMRSSSSFCALNNFVKSIIYHPLIKYQSNPQAQYCFHFWAFAYMQALNKI